MAKLLVADPARVRLLLCVGPHVDSQLLGREERFLALITLALPLPMTLHVVPKHWACGAFLVTLRAEVSAFRGRSREDEWSF